MFNTTRSVLLNLNQLIDQSNQQTIFNTSDLLNQLILNQFIDINLNLLVDLNIINLLIMIIINILPYIGYIGYIMMILYINL